MRPIKVSTSLDPRELPKVLHTFASISGVGMWSKRIKSLHLAEKDNPYLRNYFVDRHGLELALGDILRYKKNTGRCPWPPRNTDEYRLYSFLVVFVQVFNKLSLVGQRRLLGSLQTGLEKEFGLGPLAFEMRIAAHLMSQGFAFDFHDLKSGGGYDFLATSGSTEIEVECKHVSADIGRQVHRADVYRLGSVLRPIIESFLHGGRGGRLVTVNLPGRLTSNKEHQQALAGHIRTALLDEISHVDDLICSVSAQSFDVAASPFSRSSGGTTEDDIRIYLEQEFRIDNRGALVAWRPSKSAVIISFQSAKPDKVIVEILKTLKEDTKSQFSSFTLRSSSRPYQ